MEVLSSVDPEYLTAEQNRKVLRSVNLIKLKLKGRICANGTPHHKFLPREEANPPPLTFGRNPGHYGY